MSQNKFMLLFWILHFLCTTKNSEPSPRNILYNFNSKIKEIYEPSKHLLFDESMVLWRGQLIFHQYIKNKKHKFGIKMYMVTESLRTYHRIIMYSGQGHNISENISHVEFMIENRNCFFI